MYPGFQEKYTLNQDLWAPFGKGKHGWDVLCTGRIRREHAVFAETARLGVVLALALFVSFDDIVAARRHIHLDPGAAVHFAADVLADIRLVRARVELPRSANALVVCVSAAPAGAVHTPVVHDAPIVAMLAYIRGEGVLPAKIVANFVRKNRPGAAILAGAEGVAWSHPGHGDVL